MFANDVNHFDLGVAKEFEMIDSVPRVIVEDEFEDDLDWRDDEGWEDIYNDDTDCSLPRQKQSYSNVVKAMTDDL